MSRSVLEENISRLLKHACHPVTSEDVEASLTRFRRRQAGPGSRGWILTALAATTFFALIVWVILYRADASRPVVGAPAPVQEEAEKKLQAALDSLVDQLGSDKPDVREKAAARLMSLGEAALEALDRAASRPDLDLRLRAKKAGDDIRQRLKLERAKLSDEELKKRVDTCAENLGMLWRLQMVYMSQFGGRMKRMPSDTGPAFWLALTTTTPPLIDATELKILVCPGTGQDPRPGFTTFRGPKVDVKNLKGEEPVGACEPGSHHGGKINVLLRTGQIRTVGPDDDLYKRALEGTVGTPPPETQKK